MIAVSLNLYNGVWSVEEDASARSFAIGFTSNTPVTQFDPVFYFGWDLKINGEDAGSGQYPIEGAKYLSSDQPILTTEHFEGPCDSECNLHVWAVHGGMRFDTDASWVIARPEKPYDSWVWNDMTKEWDAPIPRPDFGKGYSWDEETGTWVEVFLQASQPYPSWLWDETAEDWYAPVPKPEDGNQYEWDEETGAWIVLGSKSDE